MVRPGWVPDAFLPSWLGLSWVFAENSFTFILAFPCPWLNYEAFLVEGWVPWTVESKEQKKVLSSIHPSTHPSIIHPPSIHPPIHHSIHLPSVNSSIHLSSILHPCTHLFIHLPIHPFIYPSIHNPSIHSPSIHLPSIHPVTIYFLSHNRF